MLKQRAGRIINIASVAGQMGNPGLNNSAAKAGVIGLPKRLPRNLLVAVSPSTPYPGFIATDMTNNLKAEENLPQPYSRLNAIA